MKPVVEGVSHRHHHGVVLGIQAVEDGLRELAFEGEPVEEPMAGGRDFRVVDGVVPRVRTNLVEHLRVIVPDGADMELLGPAGLGVHDGLVVQERAAELLQLPAVRGDAHQDLLEDQFNLHVLVVGGIEVLQPVVGELAAHGREEVVALLQGLAQVAVGLDFHPGGHAELQQIGLVGIRILDGHRLVRAPGGNHLRTEGVLRDHLVPAEVVGRIVGGADHLHAELADEGLATELGRRQLRVALLEDLAGRRGAQELVDAEHPAQLQMRPVIQRVPHRVWNGLRPLLEGFPSGVLAAGEVVLGNTVRPHRAPFVVVAVVAVHQPELGDVAELDVLGDLLRHEVAVVVDDGHFRRVLVVELAGGLRLEHEVVVDETHISLCFE